MGMKNYVFAAKCPTENLAEIERQMRAAHRYRNKLAELEITRRKRSEAVLCKLSPEYAEKAAEVAAAEAVYDALIAEVKATSQAARKKIPISAEMDARLTAAYREKKKAGNRAAKFKTAAYALLRTAREPYEKQAEEEVRARMPEPLTEELKKKAARDGTWTKAKFDKQVHIRTAQLTNAAGLQDFDQLYKEEWHQARAACECYWGTYGHIEDSMAGAHKGPPPRYKKSDGSGVICITPAKVDGEPMTVATAQSKCSGWFQLDIANEEELAVRGKSRGQRAVGTARLRIGAEDRTPIWATIPVVFCRFMPPNARIAKAFIHRRRVGTKTKWSVRITLDVPDHTPLPEGEDNNLIAIHPGWRVMRGAETTTLRVCTARGSDGTLIGLNLSEEQLANYDKLARLASERDLLMNEMYEWFTTWLKATTNLPQWFYNETATIGLWQSQSRFATLAHLWRRYVQFCRLGHVGNLTAEVINRDFNIPWYLAETWATDIALPEDSYEMFHRFAGYRNGARDISGCSWLVRDSLIYDHWSNLSERLVFRRRDIYRKFVRDLSRRYKYCVLANINWAELLKSDELGPAHDEQTVDQRRYGRVASPGELWRYAKEAFNGRAIIVKPEDITRKHAACGSDQEFDRKQLMHTCTVCGNSYDQDHNGCDNQLDYAAVVIAEAGGLAQAAALPPPSKIKPRIDPETGEELPPKSLTKTRGRRAKKV